MVSRMVLLQQKNPKQHKLIHRQGVIVFFSQQIDFILPIILTSLSDLQSRSSPAKQVTKLKLIL